MASLTPAIRAVGGDAIRAEELEDGEVGKGDEPMSDQS
jgi:hypothetical protein